MKRFLIVLIVILFVGVSLAEAKVEFGSWDKWNESLPSCDNKDWQETYSTFVSYPLLNGSLFWICSGEKWKIFSVVEHSLSAGTEDVFFLLTRLSFIEKKVEASIILFSPAQISSAQIDKAIKKISIKDALAAAEFALVAFPPKKGEVVVRAYEKKSGSFLFLEEWIVPFKNNSVIFPEKTTEFTQKYGDWLHEQGIEEKKYHVLPRLIIRDGKKKEFCLGVALEVFDEDAKEIKTVIF